MPELLVFILQEVQKGIRCEVKARFGLGSGLFIRLNLFREVAHKSKVGLVHRGVLPLTPTRTLTPTQTLTLIGNLIRGGPSAQGTSRGEHYTPGTVTNENYTPGSISGTGFQETPKSGKRNGSYSGDKNRSRVSEAGTQYADHRFQGVRVVMPRSHPQQPPPTRFSVQDPVGSTEPRAIDRTFLHVLFHRLIYVV